MFFDHIERLKQKYTDQWVIVDTSCPELKRFAGQNGRVKTVNMSGRALVEFDAYDNIGWYDIDPAFLTIMEEPMPRSEVPKKSAAAQKASTALRDDAQAPAAKKGSGMSVADILAAARGGGAPAATSAPAVKPPRSPLEKATPEKKSAAKTESMSVADILAAARRQAAGSDDSSPAAAGGEPTAKTDAAVDVTEQPEPESVSANDDGDQPSTRQALPTDVASIVAMCRDVDGG